MTAASIRHVVDVMYKVVYAINVSPQIDDGN